MTATLDAKFTAGELAGHFGVDPKTIRNWTVIGLKIKGVRVKLGASGGAGGRRRYTREDVEEFRRRIVKAD